MFLFPYGSQRDCVALLAKAYTKGASHPWTPSQEQRLEHILADSHLQGAVVSVTVTDLNGNSVFEHNSGLHVVPASNEKLLSASFALWETGPDYRPKTLIWNLPDRVVIDAPGDPLMTYAELTAAARKLNLDGRKPVYVHQAYAPEIPSSWEVDDLPNRFSAPVSALTFDQGGFEAWCKGGRAVLLPRPFGVKVVNLGGTGKVSTDYDPFARRITVRGALPAKDQLLDTLALPRADEAAASIFGSRLLSTNDLPTQPADIVITGGSTADMIAACLPPSDNDIAENLLLIGAAKEGDLGSNPYRLATERETKFFTRVVGVDAGDIHPYDGSGLSRHNYVTTRAVAKILSWSAAQPTGTMWRNSMSVAGKNGTLRNRLKGLTFQGKTGSLDMVVALSGYLTTKSGKELVVSIVLNEFGCSEGQARAAADQLVADLANDQ